jgi:hypothetical protein
LVPSQICHGCALLVAVRNPRVLSVGMASRQVADMQEATKKMAGVHGLDQRPGNRLRALQAAEKLGRTWETPESVHAAAKAVFQTPWSR